VSILTTKLPYFWLLTLKNNRLLPFSMVIMFTKLSFWRECILVFLGTLHQDTDVWRQLIRVPSCLIMKLTVLSLSFLYGEDRQTDHVIPFIKGWNIYSNSSKLYCRKILQIQWFSYLIRSFDPITSMVRMCKDIREWVRWFNLILNWNYLKGKGERWVCPVSRGCLLLRGTWSFLRIFIGSPCCSTLDTMFSFWSMISFDTLLTYLFCIQAHHRIWHTCICFTFRYFT
jgi:hypothetical protein